MQRSKKQTECHVLKVHLLDYQYAFLQRLSVIRRQESGRDCPTGELIRESLHLLQQFYCANASEHRPLRMPGYLFRAQAETKMEEITIAIKKTQHNWLKEVADSASLVSDEYITNASVVRLAVEMLREKYPC